MATSVSECHGSPSEFNGQGTPGQGDSPQGAILNLRMVRGPLEQAENESIISQYNSLASAAIPTRQFLRWVQAGSEGPAWHAILEAKNGEIVGHTSLIPIRATHNERFLIAAKSEYSFIREEFRASKIRGFEHTGRLKNLIYIDELFRQCRSEGWGPLLISTPSMFHRVFRTIACYPVDFPLWECLLILRPLNAARKTVNLRGWQRVSLWGAGLAQTAFWSPVLSLSGPPKGFRSPPVDGSPLRQSPRSLSFFEDQNSLAWRYPTGHYERIAAETKDGANLIVKCGSPNQYLRVCQWHLNSEPLSPALIAQLIHRALQQQALGVRWAVYGEDVTSALLVGRLRKFGFLCARRVRTLLINATDPQYLDPGTWNLTDAMFSFDV